MSDPDTRDEADESPGVDLMQPGQDASSVAGQCHQHLRAETQGTRHDTCKYNQR